MRKIIVVSILLIVGLSLVWYTFPKTHSHTLQGVSYQLGNEEFVEKVTIKIDGKFKKSLTGERTFKGTIDIEGEDIPVPLEERTLELVFNDNIFKDDYFASIVYSSVKNAVPRLYSYGFIFINKDFTQLTIVKFNKDNGEDFGGTWSAYDGLMITAPVDTREQALSISNALMSGFLEERGETLE
ncbi:MAG: hypothetical protein ACK4M9_21880 [Anaerobacillus sp.]|uniref:hypothetical protein n=1 Tax=Anaerobacillus sp. TaxID=1872506 RepID=UPI00391B2161